MIEYEGINKTRSVNKLSEAKYKRVLLKLSGEALAGEQKTGVNVELVGKICDKIKEVTEMGVEVGIVVGGGNFWRGRNGHQMERATADYMGMLATAMNGLALQDALEARGVHSRVQTAIEMREIAEPFIKRKAVKHKIQPQANTTTALDIIFFIYWFLINFIIFCYFICLSFCPS